MMLQERYNESNALLRTLINEEPNNADYWKYQANVYVGLDRPLDAAEVLEIRDRMGRSDAPSLEMLGAIYFNNQLYDVAYDVYKRALRTGGTRFDALYNSTNALAAVGRYEEAMDLVKRLRERFSSEIADDKDKRLNLLVLEATCLRAIDEVDRAAEILNKIVVEDPMNGRALIELGLYYRGLEVPDYQRAITMFERAANIPEFAAQANVQHGQLLVRMQRYRDAVRVLRRAQEIAYNDNVQDFLLRVEREPVKTDLNFHVTQNAASKKWRSIFFGKIKKTLAFHKSGAIY
jgi:tetratricopeptide (TPR) repeat protein